MCRLYTNGALLWLAFFSNQVYSETLLVENNFTIQGSVVVPTCSINAIDSGGLTQNISVGDYTVAQVSIGGTEKIEIPLKVDCRRTPIVDEIGLKLELIAAYPEVISLKGAIKTNLEGVAIALRWKHDDSVVDFDGGDYKEKKISNDGTNTFDGSLIGKVVHIPGEIVQKGSFQSAVNIAIRYY
ncbi:fimbrial protein [Photobacterium piscicola]|uniref:fimbrial protein n=1 Tax=Photobacterium piscicola TaxID=1378299 RepID=UPI003735A3D3